MRVEVNNGVTFLYPDMNKKLKRIDDNTLLSAVALAKSDIKENYEEVDELWTPELENITEPYELFDDLIIEPDSEGKVNYEDVKLIVAALNIVKKRIIDMESKLNQ